MDAELVEELEVPSLACQTLQLTEGRRGQGPGGLLLAAHGEPSLHMGGYPVRLSVAPHVLREGFGDPAGGELPLNLGQHTLRVLHGVDRP